MTLDDASAGGDRDNSPSSRLARRYRWNADSLLNRYFDEDVWAMDVPNKSSLDGDPNDPTRPSSATSFDLGIAPEDLLDDAPTSIWPGLMPCHFVPLLHNGGGDSLCLRIADDGSVSEVVNWFHGGGDWTPWADNVAEAIVLDAWMPRLRSLSRVTDAASPTPPDGPDVDPVKDETTSEQICAAIKSPRYRWAIEALNVNTMPNPAVSENELIAWFRRHNIARPAMDLARATLATRNPTAPPNGDDDGCDGLTTRHPAMAWAWEAVGLDADAHGNHRDAIESFDRAARCSAFTTAHLRFGHGTRTDATAAMGEVESVKFGLAMLNKLQPDRIRGDDYLRRLTLRTVADQQQSIHNYWFDIATQFELGDRRQLFALHMSAWDVGLPTMTQYRDVIRFVAQCAEANQADARAAVAQAHLCCIESRYVEPDEPGNL